MLGKLDCNMFLHQIRQLTPQLDISANDTMFGGGSGHYYFGVGRSALMVIAAAMVARLAYAQGDRPIDTILDYGSGYGRVARYLRVAFPDATVEVTDYDPAGPAWCIDNLGCASMPSELPQSRYDLIWLGSVFTHLPEEVTRSILNKLVFMLKPIGVLVFTTGGRLGLENITGYLERKTDQKYSNYNMTDDAIRTIIDGWNSRNYGYCDYHNQEGYGGALINSIWVQNQMAGNGLVQIHFQEMGWDSHQDVYAYMPIRESMVSFATKKGTYL